MAKLPMTVLMSQGLEAIFERYGFQVLLTETVSRFDSRTKKRKLRFKAFGAIYCPVLEGVLHVTDKANLGMYANVYFRKGRPALSGPSGRRR